ncbi:MAG: CotH kinase family protein [Bacteroidota bacterium]|nr:CotH kinase family protein [Bacteroidota bacterium]
MKKLIFVTAFFPLFLFSQTIDHWETAVFDDDIWKYLEGTSEPDTNWRKLAFNDATWLQGQGGIGYGDGDDNTIVNSVISLYLRKTFTIVDTFDIGAAILHVDYDDAFVAYLNNVEIARANIGTPGDHPLYNQGSSSLHEAQMYQGGNPDQFIINPQLLSTILNQGNNVLSVQVHNDNISSSDLTGRIFLSLGISTTSTNYSPTPSWFVPPLIFTSSNLPIVVINTNGQTIQDDPRIVCDMGIIDNGFGNINSINDPYNDYNGKISIEYRGSSSQSFPKKPYALETQDSIGNNNNISLLGMPVENDWILYAPYSDKALMRNFLTFDLGRKMGNYSPRTVYCELVVNGDYRGIYVLMEKIKRDTDRVDIARLDADDLAGDSLTGGYIVKIDRSAAAGSGGYWTSAFSTFGGNQSNIQYYYPKYIDILPQQEEYIKGYVDSFELALNGPNFADTSIGYAKYIDVNSFIDLYIINELSKNIDGYRLSTYMYKDRDDNGGKLTMGPFWDYNLAFGNADYCDGGITSGWEVDGGCGGNNPFWFERLLDDTTYQNKLKCRWEYLRARSFHQDSLFNFIDSMALYLNDAQQRNFQKWNILGNYVWPNYYVGNTYQDELNFFKTWIVDRSIWIDNNLGGNCYEILGCTDPFACNYDPIANTNDGSCNYNSESYDTLVSSISINWNSIILSASGDYSFSLVNAVGCDSIANINFTLNVTGTENIASSRGRVLIRVTDILGQEAPYRRNTPLFYIYDDGTVEKRIVIE